MSELTTTGSRDALEGAAAALLELAERQRQGADFERAWGGGKEA